MNAQDPVLHLVDPFWRQQFLDFVNRVSVDEDFSELMNTDAACYHGLSARAHYEESIVFILTLHRRIINFVTAMEPSIQAEVLLSFITNRQSQTLEAWLAVNTVANKSIQDFRSREAMMETLWKAEVANLDEAIPATTLTRRFQRIRRLWRMEKAPASDPILALIDEPYRLDFQTFVRIGYASPDFSVFMNTDFAGQRAVRIQAHYEENILHLIGFRRRLRNFSLQIIDRWRPYFLSFFATGNVNPVFQEYLKAHHDVDEKIRDFLDTEQGLLQRRLDEVKALTADESLDQATMFKRRFEHIHRLWMEEGLTSG